MNTDYLYTNDFKRKVQELRNAGKFQRDILFNGAKSDFKELTTEEQEFLSRGFKRFISQNIISNMNEEVEFILSCSTGNFNAPNDIPFSWEDVENETSFDEERAIDEILKEVAELDEEDVLYMCDNKNTDNKEELIKLISHEMGEDEIKDFVEDCSHLLTIDINDFEESCEVMQWFLVSGWLCGKLCEYGETTITSYNYWGRQCYGQSVELDGCLQEIFLNNLTKEY